MNISPKLIRISQFVAVLLCGAAIKMYYSTANVNDLLWILAPTKFLVSLTTGVSFTFESYSGFMSSDHSFIIAAACSGINFLIAAFLMLAIGKLLRSREGNLRWRFLPISLLAAYVTTIVANTFRISTALFIRRADPQVIWLNPEDLHRFEGIVIYFGFLLLLYIVSEKVSSDAKPRSAGVVGMVRAFWFPLAIYYATAVGVPLANGAFRRGTAAPGFWQHSLFVLLTPIFLLFTLATLSFLKRWVLQLWHVKVTIPIES